MQKYLQQAKDSIQTKTLYVVATPIGNLSDITLRALAVLERADLICAEDTRGTGQLLNAYGIRCKMVSVREHNEAQMAKQIINALENDQVVVQVSDAGTPAVCDPGARLVAAVREAGLAVCPIVGASALIGALSAAAMVAPEFYFGGFLPAKSVERQTIISQWQKVSYTVVVYETPHRIVDALRDLQIVLGSDRRIVLARELTKTFETILDGSIEKVLTRVKADSNQTRGEFVLLIEGTKTDKQADLSDEAQRITTILAGHLPTKQAAQIASALTGEKKKALYDFVLKLKNTENNDTH